MKKDKALNIGSKLVFINGLFMIVYAFSIMLFTELVLEEHFKKVGLSWAVLAAESPQVALICTMMLKVAGLGGIVASILLMYFAAFCYKGGSKSAWWVWILAGGIGWGGLVFLESSLWTPVTSMMAVIGFAIFIASVAIPAKAVFSNHNHASE